MDFNSKNNVSGEFKEFDERLGELVDAHIQHEHKKLSKIFVLMLEQGLSAHLSLVSNLFMEAVKCLSIALETVRNDGDPELVLAMRLKAKAIYWHGDLDSALCNFLLNIDAAIDAERFYKKTVDIAVKEKEKLNEQMVYFILNPDCNQVKIGCSINPATRLRNLATQSGYRLDLLKVMPGGKAAENSLHKKFKHLRVSGEWFQMTEEISSFIESIK